MTPGESQPSKKLNTLIKSPTLLVFNYVIKTKLNGERRDYVSPPAQCGLSIETPSEQTLP